MSQHTSHSLFYCMQKSRDWAVILKVATVYFWTKITEFCMNLRIISANQQMLFTLVHASNKIWGFQPPRDCLRGSREPACVDLFLCFVQLRYCIIVRWRGFYVSLVPFSRSSYWQAVLRWVKFKPTRLPLWAHIARDLITMDAAARKIDVVNSCWQVGVNF